ncbi:MAG TPA: histone deacetylase [Nocardioidaceae bacterium]
MTETQTHVSPLPREGEVWYVSYGSNMAERRLTCYIEGGCPPGGSRANPGARDRRPPRHSVGVQLPGSVYFAGRSPQWGGGVAFYDHETPGPAAARAYLVTAEQLADIAAQEMYRVPDPDDPIEEIVLGGLDAALDGRHHLGPGRYETLVEVGRIGGAPMLTFTSPHGIDHVDHSVPSDAYLAMMAEGLREGHCWDDDEVDRYLGRLLRGRGPAAVPHTRPLDRSSQNPAGPLPSEVNSH